MSRISRSPGKLRITYQTQELIALPPAVPMFGDKTYNHVRHQFADLAALVAVCPRTAPAGAPSDTAWGDNDGFTGTRNIGEAFKLATDGWQDGATQAKATAERLAIARPTQRRMSRQCRMAGAVPDVARAIAGNPEHMRQIKPREVVGKVVTLVADTSASSEIPADRLLLNAVCAAAVVDAMENAGFRVELVARAATGSQDCSPDTAIFAKHAGEPLDLGKVAFVCGHPAMLRRLVFALWCSDPALRGVGAGLGLPQRSKPDAESGFFVVPAAQQNLPGSTDVADIFDGMVAALREQGCPGLTDER